MPLYSYICECCEQKQTRFLPVARYQEAQYCRTPGCPEAESGVVFGRAWSPVGIVLKPMTKIIEAPAVFGDYPGYVSPATGKWVEGRKAHIEDLKQSGCRILEPGESRQEFKKAEQRLEKLHKEIDTAVETTARELGISE